MIADTSSPGAASVPDEFASCLAGVRAGNQDAARHLVARLRPMVNRIIHVHLPRRDSPEDIAQEVFMKIFARLSQYRGGSSFRRWVSQITLRTCFDHLRAQRCRPEMRHADLTLDEVTQLDMHVGDTGPGMRDRFSTRELLEELLSQLSADDRRVVVMFNLEQKSIAEISLATRWSRDLVKMRVFRARRKLQRLLAKLPRWDTAGATLQRRSAKRAGKIGARAEREKTFVTDTRFFQARAA